MPSISEIPALSDNYIWCVADAGQALIVDPGQAAPVLDHLHQQRLTLDTILVTHHHPDHVGGIKELIKAFPGVRIIGPADSPFSGSTETVTAGDTFGWGTMTFRVLGVPGHTLDHIAYFCESGAGATPALFCGDTLFVCGCGRLFEGTPAQMRQSLQSLRALPDQTQVYCAHEYTLANLAYARHLLPEDDDLAAFEARCRDARGRNVPTVPSTLGDEKSLNPFLRWDDPMVVSAARRYALSEGLPADSDDAVFAAIRHGKDHFRG